MSGLFQNADGEFLADIKANDGRRIRRKFGADKVRAFRRFDALVEEFTNEGRDEHDPLVISFLTETFLPAQRRLRSYESSENAVRAVVRFLDSTERKLRLGDVGKHHMERLRAYYADRKPRTVNAYTQKLSQALNLATDMGLVPSNPLARVKPLTVDNRRTKFLSMEGLVRIIHVARETNVRDLSLVLGLTGLRPSTARMLTVGEVDFTNRVLRVQPQKMKNARWGIVPVSRCVADVLADRLGEVGDGPDALLFPAVRTENSPKQPRNIRRAFATVAEHPGCGAFATYDLRHFFASQLAKQGANEQQIGRLLCHIGQSVTSRYVHQDIEDLRPFVDELSERYLATRGALTRPLDEDDPAIRI